MRQALKPSPWHFPLQTLLILSCCWSFAFAGGGEYPQDKEAAAGASSSSPGGVKQSDSALGPLRQTLAHYGKTPTVKMQVEKTFKPGLVGKPRTSQGELYFTKGKMRLEITSSPKSLMILDGKQIWMVDDGSEFGTGDLITRVQMSQAMRKNNSFLALLFDEGEHWNRFKVVKVTQPKGKGTVTTLEMQPKPEAQLPDITKLLVELDLKQPRISRIAYWDSLDNEVSYLFPKVEFLKKKLNAKFRYEPPKGADITEL
jgi:outer membrane lipoprotein carrier protein